MGIILAVLFGPLVWAAHLLVVYGAHAVMYAMAGRSAGMTSALIPVFALSTALALVLVAIPLALPRHLADLLCRRPSDDDDRFLLSLMRWLAALSLIGVVANGLAMLMVPPG